METEYSNEDVEMENKDTNTTKKRMRENERNEEKNSTKQRIKWKVAKKNEHEKSIQTQTIFSEIARVHRFYPVCNWVSTTCHCYASDDGVCNATESFDKTFFYRFSRHIRKHIHWGVINVYKMRGPYINAMIDIWQGTTRATHCSCDETKDQYTTIISPNCIVITISFSRRKRKMPTLKFSSNRIKYNNNRLWEKNTTWLTEKA